MIKFFVAEWLTDDLLNTIQNGDESVMTMLSNPEFAKVLDEFQKDPQNAMLKYKNNTKILDFFKKFSQIMGNHFVKLGSNAV